MDVATDYPGHRQGLRHHAAAYNLVRMANWGLGAAWTGLPGFRGVANRVVKEQKLQQAGEAVTAECLPFSTAC